jgi:ABC-type glycerol-3-phosphate transport system permease component
MISANTPTPALEDVKELRRLHRKTALRFLSVRGLVYLVLGGFAAMMIFPFIYMFATSLKDASDVFTYPPRVLPREAVTTVVDGVEVPLYEIEVEGETLTLALVEQGMPAGVFAPTDDLEATVVVPADRATASGRTVTVAEQGYALYRVPIAGEMVELALIRETAVGRFVDPEDRTVEAFAVARTSQPAETLTANWSNYDEVLGIRDFDRAITNTILVTILVVSGSLFTSIMGGYAFARIRFPGRDKIFVGYLGSIMIPFVVLMIPLFQIVVQLNWNNSLSSLVWPFIFTAYGTFLMRQFFVSIPKDLEEAAFIDGASRWRVLWRIFVPLSWPAIATLATFQFLYAWNSFIWPLVVIDAGNTKDHVLTLALSILGGQGADQPQLIFAGVTLAMTVPMVVFVMAQRYFVENVASSGIK